MRAHKPPGLHCRKRRFVAAVVADDYAAVNFGSLKPGASDGKTFVWGFGICGEHFFHKHIVVFAAAFCEPLARDARLNFGECVCPRLRSLFWNLNWSF